MGRRVVVLGGTGFIGRAYAWRCAAHGLSQQLTIPTRSPAHGSDLRPLPGRVIVAAGDFDGDGHVDLLERRRSGTLAALLLDGTVARAKTPISKLAAGDRVVRSDGGAAR